MSPRGSALFEHKWSPVGGAVWGRGAAWLDRGCRRTGFGDVLDKHTINFPEVCERLCHALCDLTTLTTHHRGKGRTQVPLCRLSGVPSAGATEAAVGHSGLDSDSLTWVLIPSCWPGRDNDLCAQVLGHLDNLSMTAFPAIWGKCCKTHTSAEHSCRRSGNPAQHTKQCSAP